MGINEKGNLLVGGTKHCGGYLQAWLHPGTATSTLSLLSFSSVRVSLSDRPLYSMAPRISRLVSFLEPATLGSFSFLKFQHTSDIESHWVGLGPKPITGLGEMKLSDSPCWPQVVPDGI